MPYSSSLARVFTMIVVALVIGACARQLTPVEIRSLESRSVAFIKPGSTTREEVLTEFGAPTDVFENERIFTYRMILRDRVGLTSVSGTPGVAYDVPRFVGGYHLIIVFDAQGIVVRYRLLKPGDFHEPPENIETKAVSDAPSK